MKRSRTAAATALFGFVVACLGGCGSSNPVAPSLAVEASRTDATMKVAKKDAPFDEGIRGPEGGLPGSDGGAPVAPKVRKPKKPKKNNPHGE